MTDMSFDQIALAPSEISALRQADRVWIPFDKSLSNLRSLNFLNYSVTGYGGEPGLTLSDYGRQYLKYLDREDHREQVTMEQYRTTKRISIAALALSIFAIIADVLIALLK